LRGGIGDDRLTGGDDADVFIYEGPGVPENTDPGRDIITDFTQGQDNLRLELFGPLDFEDLSITVQNGNTIIDLSEFFGNAPGSQTITLVGVTALTSADVFIF
jgi:Ca2+-binding RTX toxin-like protein